MKRTRRGLATIAVVWVMLAGACGGEDSDGSSTGSPTGAGGSSSGTGSGAPVCEGSPSEGQPCSPPGYQCIFPGSPCGGTATCVDSQWQVEVTCPPDDECPTMAPSDGQPCMLNNPVSGPLECSYPCPGDPSNESMATCDDTTWFIAPCPGGGGGAGTGGAGGA